MPLPADNENLIVRRVLLVNGLMLQVCGWIIFGVMVTVGLARGSLIAILAATAGLLLVIGGTGYRAWAKRDTRNGDMGRDSLNKGSATTRTARH